jgi:hypothetical protein
MMLQQGLRHQQPKAVQRQLPQQYSAQPSLQGGRGKPGKRLQPTLPNRLKRQERGKARRSKHSRKQQHGTFMKVAINSKTGNLARVVCNRVTVLG